MPTGGYMKHSTPTLLEKDRQKKTGRELEEGRLTGVHLASLCRVLAPWATLEGAYGW
jgi:hypothetical protein